MCLGVVVDAVDRAAGLTENLRDPKLVMLLEFQSLELFALDDAIAQQA